MLGYASEVMIYLHSAAAKDSTIDKTDRAIGLPENTLTINIARFEWDAKAIQKRKKCNA